MGSVYSRCKGDGAVIRVIVTVRVDSDIGSQNDRPTERNRGVVDRNVAIERDRSARIQCQPAAKHNRPQGDVVAGDREIGQLGRATDRSRQRHRAGPCIKRQRIAAVHGRGECDRPGGVVIVSVAVDRHRIVKGHRTVEPDVAVPAPVAAVQRNSGGAGHRDCTRDPHTLQRHRSSGDRQAGQTR